MDQQVDHQIDSQPENALTKMIAKRGSWLWRLHLVLLYVYSALIVIYLVHVSWPDVYTDCKNLALSELHERGVIDMNKNNYPVMDITIVHNSELPGQDLPVPTNTFAHGLVPPSWWKNGGDAYTDPKMVSQCGNCWLYPVNKENALAADYEPSLVATGLPGGGKLVPEAKAQLVKLFTAANAKGLTPKVNSSYRSYAEQVETYNYWVQREMAKGKTRADAELAANRFSARPGHSEHQLGTTVDINCLSCSPFDKSSKGNWAIWAFLSDNAHKYGFVISYPEGKEAITGYVYEPWHLRYIGVEHANSLYELNYLQPGNQQHVTAYLLKLANDK